MNFADLPSMESINASGASTRAGAGAPSGSTPKSAQADELAARVAALEERHDRAGAAR
jgi:hypothetical protein